MLLIFQMGAKDNIETAKSAYKVFSSNGKRFSV